MKGFTSMMWGDWQFYIKFITEISMKMQLTNSFLIFSNTVPLPPI
jgi:hypothetical protein